MQPFDANATGFRKNIDLSRLSPVSGFWWFVMFLIAVSWLLVLTASGAAADSVQGGPAIAVWAGAALLLITAMIRRLRDTGRAGASYFFYFLRFIGQLVLLVGATPTAPRGNRYGPGPQGSGPSAPSA